MAAESDMGESNRKFFNDNAHELFEQQWVKDLLVQITEHLQTNISWLDIRKPAGPDDAPVRMLDYACGTGVASRALFPYVSEIRGVDISDGMVEKYNTAARTQGVTPARMHAIQGNLFAPAPAPAGKGEGEALSTKEYFDFDIIVMSMALHHVEDPSAAVKALVRRLRDGGVVLIIDRTPTPPRGGEPRQGDLVGHAHDGAHAHGVHSTVAHDGFSEDDIKRMLEGAGCREVGYMLAAEPTVLPVEFGGQMQVFFARGRK